MKKTAEQLLAIDRQYFMHPSTHAHDHETGALQGRIVTGAKGIRITDHRNETFIDGFAGLYCVNIGYGRTERSEEHTSELQSLMRISYAVFCLKTKKPNKINRVLQLEVHRKSPANTHMY